MIDPEPSRKLGEALELLHMAPSPDETFLNALENRIRANAREYLEENSLLHKGKNIWSQIFFPDRRVNWSLIAVVFLTVVGLIIFAIGPQRVLAQIQSLFDYVPGVGFFSPETARVLASPASQTKGEITMRVSEFAATSERTVILLESEGLPAQASATPGDGFAGNGPATEFSARLLLPDGTVLSFEQGIESVDWLTGRGKIVLKFRPLPPGVENLTLEISSANIVANRYVPRGWRFELALKPATAEEVAGTLTQTYDYSGVIETKNGVTLRILSVAFRDDQTALRAHLQWAEEMWEFEEGSTFLNARFIELSDDLGNVYEHIDDSGGWWVSDAEALPVAAGDAAIKPGARAIEQNLIFAPIKPGASQLTLRVDDIELYIPPRALGEIAFEIDLGENPQAGDRWPLDTQLNIAGFPVHVPGVRILEDAPGPYWGPGLEIEFEPVPMQDGISLVGYSLDMNVIGVAGRTLEPASDGGFTAALYMEDGSQIPHGSVRISVEDAAISVNGPWELTFAAPFSN